MNDAMANGAGQVKTPAPRKITLLGLIAATYFMVAGGPYGLEDIVQETGYLGTVLVLAIIPFLWSLPSALMVSELSSALPEEGGYYVWVRRALGPFWGFQVAWLALTSTIFDMAIYPILFVTYLGLLGKYAPASIPIGGALAEASHGAMGVVLGLAMIATCVAVNLRPPRSVGRSSVWMSLAMLSPFAILCVLAVACSSGPAGTTPPGEVRIDYVTALLFGMWNYMGWDCATTFASDVERPQRTFPLAMAAAVCLVTLTYIVPVLAATRTGILAENWETGAWVMIGERTGGPWLALAIGLGGMISALGMFNSFVLSYSRLPVALAEDGYLPTAFLRRTRTGAPWFAIIVCAVAWSLATQLGLKRVLALDVILYGLSLLLEFAAMVTLRIREPDLPRPFRVPGGTVLALGLGLAPAALITLAIFDQAGRWQPEEPGALAPAVALLVAAGLAALGPILYFAGKFFRTRGQK